jgi:hypothetical protein
MAAAIIATEGVHHIPSQPTADDDSARSQPPAPRVIGLNGLLIELLLPVALSASVLLLLTGYTSYWNLRSPLGLAVFGLLLVTLSAFLSLRLDALTLQRRRSSGKRRLLNRASPRWRLSKLVLGGLAIPIAALCAASLLELPNHQTPLALVSTAVRSKLAQPEVGRAVRLGDAVIRARSASARAQGILALQGMASVEAVDQLLRLLDDDPAVLDDVSEYRALSTALASYGAVAKVKLLQRFNAVPPGARASAPAPPGDAFERELATPAAGPVEGDAGSGRGGKSLPSFVLQTFIQMTLTEDADLLELARRTAADEQWSPAVRGQALELTAALGGRTDLDGLYAYLESPSPRLQAHALRAIATLQSRLSAAATKR